MKPLLIEIGIEELPGVPLVKELPHIHAKWQQVCRAYNLEIDSTFEYTPRRLVFWHPRCPDRQADSSEELFGPPHQAAFKEGQPTPAAIGFAKKCGEQLESLGTIEQKGRQVLYFKRTITGQPIGAILGAMIEQFLSSLNFGKTMRWGSGEHHFIRPIRWLAVLHGEEPLGCEVFGVASKPHTFGHRVHSYDPQPLTNADHYEDFLLKRGVMLSAAKRREKIRADFGQIEQENPGFNIEIDDDLLDEIVAISEHPMALLGSFDEHFLQLPAEVIVTSMKSHQRYFPVYRQGKLSNHFVVVSNALADDFSAVIAGNEKVLRPRLADGLFFWHNDLASGLDSAPLADIVYVQGLGSMLDKVRREEQIAARLLTFLGLSDPHLDRAASLAKADLLTQMVYEFTELQGVMGMHYARAAGEDEAVALALMEQYYPLGEGGALPSTQTGTLLALGSKLDSLMALFSAGHIPSGSKDPLALRRAATGVLRLAVEKELTMPLDRLLAALTDLYQPFDHATLERFILERLYHVLDVNPSLIAAVLASGEKDINQIAKKAYALDRVSQGEGFKEGFTTFKRVANILKNESIDQLPPVDPALFEEPQEGALYQAFEAIGEGDYLVLLERLFGLKPLLDDYFETVMVNAEDAQIRGNRLATIARIYLAFRQVADIKEITFS